MKKNSIERGKALIEEKFFEFEGLKAVPFSLPFDWCCDFGMGNSFSYRLHTFSWLRYLCDYHKSSHNQQALEVACNTVDDWLENFSQTSPQGLKNNLGTTPACVYVWHDHATALRAENWLLLMEYCQQHERDFWAGKAALCTRVKKALIRHASILAEDAFYSIHCNHGIEQARVLLRLAEEPSLSDFSEAESKSWRDIAISRLTDEFNTCFTGEGVHKENSPGYHTFVFKTLLNILADPHLHAVHDILHVRFTHTARQALEYITHILQPNQCLPIIGDTEHIPVSDTFKAALGTTPEYGHYRYAATAGQQGIMPATVNKVYPESGWAILRSSWDKEDYPNMLHLVCKAGCLVRYHHQMDEGHFILFARGEHWFIDSGFFDYNRQTDIYKYIRNRKAHNVPIVIGANLKDFDERTRSWHMDSWAEAPGNAHVSMVNSIYENVILRRRIDYSGGFALTLTDEVECTDKNLRDVQFLFHIPKDKQVTAEGNIVRIESTKNICLLRIDASETFTIQVSKGKTSAGIIRSQVSWRSKQCEDSYLIGILFKKIQNIKVTFHIDIFDKSDKSIKKFSQQKICLQEECFLQDRKLYAQLTKRLQSDFLQQVVSDAHIDAISLYRYAHEALKRNDLNTAKRCEILNKILNHCIIPASCHIGQGTRLAYGGLGILIHANAYIGEYCTIGTNATLASSPKLGDFIYVATGAKIIKPGISIGSFSIIGANAVVTHDVPPCSIVVGIPSRVVKKITPENINTYLTPYLASARKMDSDFMKSVQEKFLSFHKKSNQS